MDRASQLADEAMSKFNDTGQSLAEHIAEAIRQREREVREELARRQFYAKLLLPFAEDSACGTNEHRGLPMISSGPNHLVCYICCLHEWYDKLEAERNDLKLKLAAAAQRGEQT